ncbi:MAG: nucleotidyltransferase domain-containing protein [Pseudomonadota bacterium]|nr:nucleotidyltransferase domain-containing protein [Pseudomonadota bacterium]
MIDLKPEELQEVRDILSFYAKGMEVLAFGSRVEGKARKFSDLDLIVIAPEMLTLRQLAKIKGAFSISDLPFMVDVLDWHTTDDYFRDIIKRNCVMLQTADGTKP